MSRIVNKDFLYLKEYISEYNLKSLSKNEELWNIYKSAHKNIYGIIALIAEIEKFILTCEEKKEKDELELEFDYLKECVSDLLSSLFISFHGAYKSAEFILRSSIEMFLRGMYSIEVHSICDEKNLYKIFESIKSAPSIIGNENMKTHFDNVHQIYVELCKYAHTSSKIQMDELYALNLFPKYNVKSLSNLISNLNKLIRNYIFMLCFRFRNEFHKIHFENKQAILDCLSKGEKPIIMGEF